MARIVAPVRHARHVRGHVHMTSALVGPKADKAQGVRDGRVKKNLEELL